MGGKGGAGLMLALIFFMLLVDGNEQKSCRGIRNFNSPGSSLVSYPLTQSHKQVSYFDLTYLGTIMKMTTI